MLDAVGPRRTAHARFSQAQHVIHGLMIRGSAAPGT
ncbi:hypothetical protein M768_04060 [Cellulosimicrobium cellulans F16]|uniref:Uncharacterized protein n=1 Tax=Cellulosimicrobium cellulans F16 TaxID=1350482 RepID=A0A0M0FCL4_CELCE|nr:hypothetical protein M768_04060 [Cellulosimicrobium cellulans F16]